MKADTLRWLLSLLNSKAAERQPRKSWLIASCPFAPFKHKRGVDAHPSFGVSIKQPHRYRCFSCNEGGDLDDLPRALKRFSPGAEYRLGEAVQLIATNEDDVALEIPAWEEREQRYKIIPWPEAYGQSFVSALQVKQAIAYLQKRRVSLATAKRLDLRWDSSRRRVVFPVRDFSGALVGMHGRTVINAEPAYLAYVQAPQCPYNVVCWLGESWVDFDKPVLMVESVFDVAAVLPIYSNVVAPMYAGLFREKVNRMADAFEIVTLFDEDNAGNEARQAINQLQGRHLITHALPQGAKDPGDMHPQALRDLLQQHNCIDKLA